MTKQAIFHPVRMGVLLVGMAVLMNTGLMNTGFAAGNNLNWIGVPESARGTITASGAVWHLPETETLEAADWTRPFGNPKTPAVAEGNFSPANPVTAPIFRKLVTPAEGKTIQAGQMTAASNAPFELYFCGEKIAVSLPGEEQVRYVTVDLTENFQKQGPDGPYAFDILTGFPGGNSQQIDALKAAAKIDVTYTDGSKETILTDESWTVTNSPVLYYHSEKNNRAGTGEILDGNFWFRTVRYCSYAGAYSLPFSQMVLGNAVNVDSEPVSMKKASASPKWTELKPKEVKQIGPNRWLADFGKDVTGLCTAVLEDQREGDLIRVRYASKLDKNGMFADAIALDKVVTVKGTDKADSGKTFSYQAMPMQYPDANYSTDYFLFGAAEKPETYAPHFVIRTFRYVEFSGIRRDKGPIDVMAKTLSQR